MKNKKSLYFLIPLVVIVWGLIVYKIINNKNEDYSTTNIAHNLKNNQETQNITDTFKLLADYNDPFLGKIAPVRVISKIQKKQSPPKVEEKKLLNWPKIVYGGIIKNKSSNKTVIIVNINGIGKLMSEGEIFNNIRIKKIYKDSIIAEFNNETKKIVK
ncbi:MAG: hypothetical protein WC223_10955 [Bacteroidales bacterium]|jgi:hypothetical protein